jgi:hypothetical protein
MDLRTARGIPFVFGSAPSASLASSNGSFSRAAGRRATRALAPWAFQVYPLAAQVQRWPGASARRLAPRTPEPANPEAPRAPCLAGFSRSPMTRAMVLAFLEVELLLPNSSFALAGGPQVPARVPLLRLRILLGHFAAFFFAAALNSSHFATLKARRSIRPLHGLLIPRVPVRRLLLRRPEVFEAFALGRPTGSPLARPPATTFGNRRRTRPPVLHQPVIFPAENTPPISSGSHTDEIRSNRPGPGGLWQLCESSCFDLMGHQAALLQGHGCESELSRVPLQCILAHSGIRRLGAMQRTRVGIRGRRQKCQKVIETVSNDEDRRLRRVSSQPR